MNGFLLAVHSFSKGLTNCIFLKLKAVIDLRAIDYSSKPDFKIGLQKRIQIQIQTHANMNSFILAGSGFELYVHKNFRTRGASKKTFKKIFRKLLYLEEDIFRQILAFKGLGVRIYPSPSLLRNRETSQIETIKTKGKTKMEISTHLPFTPFIILGLKYYLHLKEEKNNKKKNKKTISLLSTYEASINRRESF